MARRIARSATPEATPRTDADVTTGVVRTRRNGDGTAGADPRRTPPTTEQIAARAYELFLARGGEHGHHDEDWFQAEQELRNTDPSFSLPPAAAPRDRRDR